MDGVDERVGLLEPTPVDERSSGAGRGPEAPLYATMSTTRAMRYLSPDPVPDELIRSIIQAALWAPSGHNAQGEAFVVVTDRAMMARLAVLWRQVVGDFRGSWEAARFTIDDRSSRLTSDGVEYEQEHFETIPALIVACYDGREDDRRLNDPGLLVRLPRALGIRGAIRVLRHARTFGGRSEAASIYPAVENLLLAARAHGLGACLTTWHLLAEEEFKAILGIPRDVQTFAVIPIGWPLRAFGPVRRGPVETVIHRERW